MAATVVPERRFVPQQIDFADFTQLQPLYSELLARKLFSAADHERWLADLSELTAAVDEFGQRRYIDKSCHTDDPDIEKRYMQFVEEIEPKIKPLFFQLQKRLLDSPGVGRLDLKRYAILIRQWQWDVEIFREQNVPLQTEAIRLITDYDKISGAMTVQFGGKELTMPQMLRFGEQTDRAVRQASWEASANRRLQDRDVNDEIFDKLLSLRQQIAVNAGLPDYRAYVWKLYKRFDYTPQLCLDFADAIAQTCVPLVKQLDAQRKMELGVESLRPWDLAVDPKNRAPLEPFREDQTNVFIDKTKSIFDRLSPELGEEFESLRRNKNLDLESRKGKQPGGYQASLEESKQPFIFMNAAGLQRDVETLLHEGGHAFHHLAAAAVEPLVFLRSAPMEFCEVASMSMEMLGSEHFDVFYNDADAARARRTMIEGVIRFFPWMATIDVFQHWLYTHPGHSRAQRTEQWLSILDRFGGGVDWTGYDTIRQSSWQRQLHLYHNPFYYVEYGIAQLGALQLWLKAKQDPNRAMSNYRAALQLGGTRPLPDLFSAAGIRFDFSQKMLGPLMAAMSEELDSLPS
jgi:oligoendopeptidase F